MLARNSPPTGAAVRRIALAVDAIAAAVLAVRRPCHHEAAVVERRHGGIDLLAGGVRVDLCVSTSRDWGQGHNFSLFRFAFSSPHGGRASELKPPVVALCAAGSRSSKF